MGSGRYRGFTGRLRPEALYLILRKQVFREASRSSSLQKFESEGRRPSGAEFQSRVRNAPTLQEIMSLK